MKFSLLTNPIPTNFSKRQGRTYAKYRKVKASFYPIETRKTYIKTTSFNKSITVITLLKDDVFDMITIAKS